MTHDTLFHGLQVVHAELDLGRGLGLLPVLTASTPKLFGLRPTLLSSLSVASHKPGVLGCDLRLGTGRAVEKSAAPLRLRVVEGLAVETNGPKSRKSLQGMKDCPELKSFGNSEV